MSDFTMSLSGPLLTASKQPMRRERGEHRYEWPYRDIADAIRSWRLQRQQNSLADLIEHVCNARGITGVELAHRLGHKTSGFISRIRNGRIPITRRTLDAVSMALDLSPKETQLLYAVAGDFSVVPIPRQRLGGLVTSMRESERMSQEDLAKIVNLDASTISRLEQGQRQTDDAELAKLTEALPGARDNPLLYYAAGRLPPEAVFREDEVAVAGFAEYVRWLRVTRESYREALDLIEPNLELLRRLPLTPVVKEHYLVELLNSYGECLLMTEHTDEAAKVAREASRRALSASNAVQVADAQSRLAGVHYIRGRNRDAVRAADDGIEMMATLAPQHRGGLAWWYGQLQLRRTVSRAYVANEEGQLDDRLVSQVDPWLGPRIENKSYAPDAWGRKAELLKLVGDVDGAFVAWTEEVKAAAVVGTPVARLDALVDGVEIALMVHEDVEAMRLLDRAHRLAAEAGLVGRSNLIVVAAAVNDA